MIEAISNSKAENREKIIGALNELLKFIKTNGEPKIEKGETKANDTDKFFESTINLFQSIVDLSRDIEESKKTHITGPTTSTTATKPEGDTSSSDNDEPVEKNMIGTHSVPGTQSSIESFKYYENLVIDPKNKEAINAWNKVLKVYNI